MSELNFDEALGKINALNQELEAKVEDIVSEKTLAMENLLIETIQATGAKLRARFPKRTIKWMSGNGTWFWVVDDIVHIEFESGCFDNPWISIDRFFFKKEHGLRVLADVVDCMVFVQKVCDAMDDDYFYRALPCSMNF